MKITTIIAACSFSLLGSAAFGADFSCEGKRFVFFPGGSEGDSFASIVYNGARVAAQQTAVNRRPKLTLDRRPKLTHSLADRFGG